MKEKKQVTEDDIELLSRHIQTTKLQIIDIKNQINKSIGRIRGTMVLFTILLIISFVIGNML